VPEDDKPKSSAVSLVAAILFPPYGLFLLWRSRRPRGKKILGTLAILFYGILYSAGIVLLLIRFAALEVEWRGGYVPVLTWHKTKPDFDALERSRARREIVPAKPAASSHTDANWTGFRGPNRDGEYETHPILTNWPGGGLRQLWRQSCGGGYSSFAMVGSRAFTLEQRREQEVAVAYDVETGRELWTNGWTAKFREYHSDEGPRATPTYSDGKIYTLGALGELRCLNAEDGTLVWAKNIATDNGAEGPPDYGLSASPLVVDDKIIVQPDAYKGKSVVCYDKRDGKRIWNALDTSIGYASPMLTTLGGERQVIVCGRPNIYGLRLEDGVERWHFLWHIIDNERPITQPVALGTNRFLVSAAYMTGSAVFEVNRTNDGFEAHELWRNRSLKAKFASAVAWQGFVYGLDEDILVCVDAETGERKWKDGRYGYGQILLASGHLIIQCANGDLALVKATPERWLEVARFPALHGKSWNFPAIGGGRLLLRNNAEMACYEISPESNDRATASPSVPNQ